MREPDRRFLRTIPRPSMRWARGIRIRHPRLRSRAIRLLPSPALRARRRHCRTHGSHHMRLRGELRPTRDASGTWRYDPADVIRASAKRGVRGLHTAGDVAAEAFTMFRAGGELRHVVKALRITPSEARRLYQDWQSSFDDPPPVRESAPCGPLPGPTTA
jgi:hypothetical protein